jgi:hypothetical protein
MDQTISMDKIIMHAIGHMDKNKSLEKMKLCSCMKFDNIEMQLTIWMKSTHMDEIDYTNKIYHMDDFLNIYIYAWISSQGCNYQCGGKLHMDDERFHL